MSVHHKPRYERKTYCEHDDKFSYRNKSSARSACRKMGNSIRVYYCEHCHGYHVTKDESPQIKIRKRNMKFYYIETEYDALTSRGLKYVSAEDPGEYVSNLEEAQLYKSREDAEWVLDEDNSEVVKELELTQTENEVWMLRTALRRVESEAAELRVRIGELTN